MYTYEYQMFCYTTDIVVFVDSGVDVPGYNYDVLLIKRKNDPYAGYWALPGGYVEIDETAKEAAVRELYEETGIVVSECQLKPLPIFDEVKRDPRNRTVSQPFVCVLTQDQIKDMKAGDDAVDCMLENIGSLKTLAFDHMEMIRLGTHLL